MEPKDPMVQALADLCSREGGHKIVAQESHTSADNLWQILNGIKLPSGKPRGVGPSIRRRLEARYPGWQAVAKVPAAQPVPLQPEKQNSLTEHMVALEIAVARLAPELRTAGRDALRKWASNDASASEAAGTLEALSEATRAMASQKKPNGPLGKAA